MVGIEACLAPQYGPGGTRVLVCQGDCSDVRSASLFDLDRPSTAPIRTSWRSTQCRSGAVDEQEAQIPVAALVVASYVKSNKNDVNDADAIAEASARPSMRFVATKSVEQEHIQQLHRSRQMAVRNRTAQINQIHGFLLEYGRRSNET